MGYYLASQYMRSLLLILLLLFSPILMNTCIAAEWGFSSSFRSEIEGTQPIVVILIGDSRLQNSMNFYVSPNTGGSHDESDILRYIFNNSSSEYSRKMKYFLSDWISYLKDASFRRSHKGGDRIKIMIPAYALDCP